MSKMTFPHIDHSIPPKTHSSLYLMHKYWARKPHNVVSEYIQTYSKEGEIVLDPFLGSGVTVVEALKSKRKVIGTDLDPMAVFITRMSIIPVDLDKFQKEFLQIENNLKSKINELYHTTCLNCNKIIPRQIM